MTSADLPDPGAAAAVAALGGRGWTLATAESLTAGMLAATVAGVPGASAVLRGGLVVYATDLKHTLAGVAEEVLRRHGAVSGETARALALGAAERCGADVGVGLTGVAGPDRQEGRAVGTVHVGICVPGVAARSTELSLDGGRAEIRRAACAAALDLLVGIADEVGNESAT
ncbi:MULTISPECIES: CinA family protein [Dietzia]|uniref:CinA family protein n=3 Tax=Dietzia TaxID=37914 RepID=A0ABN2I1Q5_9ACTN|nr:MULTISPECIES: nicotinamide-nucleotide amidohydrolase family protein [Dietzia]MBB1041583.1 nicotinamide-nucleotide amidohydrolase family protein [Dietzia sp. Cai40]MBB1046263.1 nicotinamide-nucleotide amidohydrolase family protein [Dietzia cercidiphylli]